DEGEVTESLVPPLADLLADAIMSPLNENNAIYCIVEGTNPDLINWRNPHYFDAYDYIPDTANNSEYKHYFTLEGQIDYVLVTWDEETGKFSPEILVQGNPNPTPEDLAAINVVDED